MFVKSLLVPYTGLMLIIGGLLGCTTLADLGVAVPYIGDPPVIQIDGLAQKPKGALVYIQGKVTDYAPFLDGGAYLVQDSSGGVWIRTRGKPPKPGQQILVKGKIEYKNINVANQDLGGVYVDEVEQLQATASKPQPSSLSPEPAVTKPQPSPSPEPVVTKPQSSPLPVVSTPPSVTGQTGENPTPAIKKPKPDAIDSFFLPHKQQQKL